MRLRRGLRETEIPYPNVLCILVAELGFQSMKGGIGMSGGRVVPLGSRLASQI